MKKLIVIALLALGVGASLIPVATPVYAGGGGNGGGTGGGGSPSSGN